jgi:hypothetical protein
MQMEKYDGTLNTVYTLNNLQKYAPICEPE